MFPPHLQSQIDAQVADTQAQAILSASLPPVELASQEVEDSPDESFVDAVCKDQDELKRLRKENTAALNLLAIIHRDGGHHTEAVGTIQSITDASAQVGEWLQKNDELATLRAQCDSYTAQIELAVDIMDGTEPGIDWSDQSKPELIRKLIEHLAAWRHTPSARGQITALRAENETMRTASRSTSEGVYRCRKCGWITQCADVSCDCEVPTPQDWYPGTVFFGIADPAEAIKAAREALEAEEAWRNAGGDSGELRSLAGIKRRKALELLTPTKL